MKKIIKFFTALIFGLIIFYLIVRRAGIGTLQQSIVFLFSRFGLLILLITLLIAVVSVFRWKVILSCQGVDRKFFDLAGIWTIGFCLDYVTPVSFMGGEAIRIYLSGKMLEMDWEDSFSSVITDKILDATFHLIFIIVGVIAFLRFGNFPDFWIFWIVTFLLLFLSSVLAFFYFRVMKKRSILVYILNLFGMKKTQIKSTKNGEFIFNTEGSIMRFFSPRQIFFWKGFLLSFLKHFLVYLRAFLLLVFLVGVFDPIKTLAIQGLAYLSLLLPLPAGLGGLEAISAFGFEVLELAFKDGIVFAMIWRSADLMVCLLGLFFGVKIGFKIFQLQTFSFIDKVIKSKITQKNEL